MPDNIEFTALALAFKEATDNLNKARIKETEALEHSNLCVKSLDAARSELTERVGANISRRYILVPDSDEVVVVVWKGENRSYVSLEKLST